jgi:hypothetical protein
MRTVQHDRRTFLQVDCRLPSSTLSFTEIGILIAVVVLIAALERMADASGSPRPTGLMPTWRGGALAYPSS